MPFGTFSNHQISLIAVNFNLNTESVYQIQETACKIAVVHNFCTSQTAPVHTLSEKHFQKRQRNYTKSP